MEKFVIKKSLDHYQADAHGFLRPVILMNWLQALADNHADKLGFGQKFCILNNCVWVVTHYLIDIVELPVEGEELQFSTWPSEHSGVRATRDFEVRGSGDRLIIAVTSQWVLVDVKSRTPRRLTDDLQSLDLCKDRALYKKFEKFSAFNAINSQSFKCRYDDIDANGHINNAVYVLWVTESLGREFLNDHKLAGLDINFVKEIGPDITDVKVDVLIEGNTSRHKIIVFDKIHANVICRWEKR